MTIVFDFALYAYVCTEVLILFAVLPIRSSLVISVVAGVESWKRPALWYNLGSAVESEGERSQKLFKVWR